jgi:guanylate kinase
MRTAAGKGKIVIISSPSGGGKTTICRRLLRHNRRWVFSVSYTTRTKREGEKNGREYFFVDLSEFAQLRRSGFFAESARVHLHYYGTPRRPLDEAIGKGNVILLDVDVKGAASIKRKYPQALSLFILPPSKAELRRRLKRRGTETRAQLAVRLNNAIAEMEKYDRFDYIIINKDINEAVTAADHIIKSWTVGVTYFGRNKSKTYPVYR